MGTVVLGSLSLTVSWELGQAVYWKPLGCVSLHLGLVEAQNLSFASLQPQVSGAGREGSCHLDIN